MALELGRDAVASGSWLYDDSVRMPVWIVGLDYDYSYELGKADDRLDEGEAPLEFGPEGLLYYTYFVGGLRLRIPDHCSSKELCSSQCPDAYRLGLI